MSGLRGRHPDASPDELRYLLAELLYGAAIAEKMCSVAVDKGALENE